MALESAQVQIKLKYDACVDAGSDGRLSIALEEARNLLALAFPDNAQVLVHIQYYPDNIFIIINFTGL